MAFLSRTFQAKVVPRITLTPPLPPPSRLGSVNADFSSSHIDELAKIYPNINVNIEMLLVNFETSVKN